MLLSVEKIGIFADPGGSDWIIHENGIGKQLQLSKKHDSGAVFKIHKPPIMGQTDIPRKALNIESMEYPGYFVMASKDLKSVILEKPTDSDSSTFSDF